MVCTGIITQSLYLLGLFRVSVIQSYLRARSAGFSGNIKGDGTLLGGMLVVGPSDQGIVYQYQASEFGDHAPLSDIVTAIDKLN